VKASFAWSNSGLLCGECHYMMDSSVSKNEFPVEFRTRCPNKNCPNYGKIFKASQRDAIQLEEITERVLYESISDIVA